MPIISKEEEIQDELASVYDLMLDKKEIIKTELVICRKSFDIACNNHIDSGFLTEKDWVAANNSHYLKFIEYEVYCHIIEIINDFKDLHGKFPEYTEMYLTLEHIMLDFAYTEKYELAAIIKHWLDKINKAILIK